MENLNESNNSWINSDFFTGFLAGIILGLGLAISGLITQFVLIESFPPDTILNALVYPSIMIATIVVVAWLTLKISKRLGFNGFQSKESFTILILLGLFVGIFSGFIIVPILVYFGYYWVNFGSIN